MRMPFLHALDVLNGELPEFGRFTFIYIAERARWLLSNCDLENAKERLDELDWFPLILDPDRFIPDASEKLKDVEPGERDATQPSLVYHHMDEFDQDDRKGFTWSEYFALMALNCISQVWLYEYMFRNTALNESAPNTALTNTLVNLTAEAAEAICLGEQLLEREKSDGNIDLLVNQRISERNSAAVKKRHEKITKLKQEFFTYYETGEFPSQAEAARRFVGELADEKRKLLASTNAERTLLEGLRSRLKSTGNGSESASEVSTV
jgi:hypothetical protein